MCALLTLLLPSGRAQDVEPEKPVEAVSTAPAAPAPRWSWAGVNVSGVLDVYTDLNFNHPASGQNQLRNFDTQANQFSVNLVKMTIEHAADPIGFRLDLGAGKAMTLYHSQEPAHGFVRYMEQAYISFKPPKAKGLQLDFGQFSTSAGAEVTETHLNWNYSRSLLYAFGPYYHFGLRAAMPVNKVWTTGVQVVNGWNDIVDNNSRKTIGITNAIVTKKVSWFTNYYVGPEKTGTNEGNRHFLDAVLLLTPTAKTSFSLNYDYGQDKRVGSGTDVFQGFSGMAHFTLSERWSISPRWEWYGDRDGFNTGTRQNLQEFTLTGEYKWRAGLLSRLEYRRDWSNQPYFDRGAFPASFGHQNTLLIGMMAYFGSER